MRRSRGWIPLILVLSTLLGAPSGRATQRLGESPHGRSDRCLSCHAATTTAAPGPGGTTGTPGAPLPSIATCRSCHPDADMHLVGIPASRPGTHTGVVVPAQFPLEAGLVTCATCHAEPACDASRERAAPWLRGGTPARKADFCYRCHDAGAMARTSPHLPVDAAPGAESGCAACHVARPEAGASLADARLLSAPDQVCATCHPEAAHAGAAVHLAATQDPGELSAEAARALPLGAGGTIGCWTCHDMHAAPRATSRPGAASRPGDLLAAAVTEAAGSAPTSSKSSTEAASAHEALLALPAQDGTLCTACHGDGP